MLASKVSNNQNYQISNFFNLLASILVGTSENIYSIVSKQVPELQIHSVIMNAAKFHE